MRQHSRLRQTAPVLVAALLAASSLLEAQPLTITHFAGTTGGAGSFDGTGSAARFNRPTGIAVDRAGNVYVADTGSHTIRRITPSGSVSTFAGVAGRPGGTDGRGSAALFDGPEGVAVDASGNVYVVESNNATVRRITPDGVVSTLAGQAGRWGSSDGTGSAARFYSPSGIAVDGSGNVYVADTYNMTIRKITPGGVVTTLAGQAGSSAGSADGTGPAARFNTPRGIVLDGSGNLLVCDSGNFTIRRVTLAGAVTTIAGRAGVSGSADGPGADARFAEPHGIALDASGNVYIVDAWANTVRRLIPLLGTVSTLAGQAYVSGSTGGSSSDARFAGPCGIAADGSGALFVADSGNNIVRRVTPAGFVSTSAGTAGAWGSTDGNGSDARFNLPQSVAVDGSGSVFVADSNNSTIRKVTPAGVVSTLAGVAATPGSTDGAGSEAQFFYPLGVTVDGSGTLYVGDSSNHTIRRISRTGIVSTIAGLAGSSGIADGAGSSARFNFPMGVAVDGSGNIYVADNRNHAIRKVTAAGVVSTYAGLAGSPGAADGSGSAARFSGPTGLAVDGSGNVYVADGGNNTIRRISPGGVVATLAGQAGSAGATDGVGSDARFLAPWSLALDGSGNIYVTDSGNHTLRRIAPTGAVSTVAGAAGARGFADGTGSGARFNSPRGVAVGASGTVYVADTSNHRIRTGVVSSLTDAATIDTPTGTTGQPRQLDTSPRQATKWLWSQARRPSGSTASLSSTTARNPTFTPDVPDLYVFTLIASDESGARSDTTVSFLATDPVVPSPLSQTVPIVLDVSNGSTRYQTELALTNGSATRLDLSMLYTASLGVREGSGTATDSLAPGEQKRIVDVLSYLRSKGLACPVDGNPQQGGTLRVSFHGSGSIDSRLASVTARTAALTSAPQPLGRAGLAYSALLPTDAFASTMTLYGLRSIPSDRTNVAVFSTSNDRVTLKVTVCSGTGDGRCVVFRAAETLPPWGWLQYSSSQILDENGITRGWAVVERTSAKGSFGAYAVINDNLTNDGSFVLPIGSGFGCASLTVPVLVETPTFRSELTLANKGTFPVTLTLDYVESLTPSSGAGGQFSLTLDPLEERIIPEAIDFLRQGGVHIGPKDEAPYGGALRIAIEGATADDVFAGARTASQSPVPGGGQFGLFTPCVYTGQEATSEAYLYGLRADAENRTNVAVLNAGSDSAGPVLLQLQAYDGDAGGVPKGAPLSVSLSPGQWSQPGSFFRSSGVANGWVKVTRMSGTAPWITYAVVNDGATTTERTGDGAYVPMVK